MAAVTKDPRKIFDIVHFSKFRGRAEKGEDGIERSRRMANPKFRKPELQTLFVEGRAENDESEDFHFSLTHQDLGSSSGLAPNAEGREDRRRQERRKRNKGFKRRFPLQL